MNSKLIAEAGQAMASGQLTQSEALCQRILASEPDSLPTLLLLGVTYVKGDRVEEAIPILEKVTEADPTSSQGPLWLSRAFRKESKFAQAFANAEIATDREPRNGVAQHQLGICYMDGMDFVAAEKCFRTALQTEPRAPTVHLGLGLALQALGRNAEAIQTLKKAAELAPRSPQILGSLYQALADESDTMAAVGVAQAILKLEPTGIDAKLRLAVALAAANRAPESQDLLAEVSAQDAEDGSAAFSIGMALQSVGDWDGAENQFRHSIQRFPHQGFAYAALAYSHKRDRSDRAFLKELQAVETDSPLPPDQLSHLHYALGKTLEDLAEYEAAMRHFDEANRLSYQLKFGDHQFDQALYAERVDQVIAKPAKTNGGTMSELPIFVVGMLRSGTTLVEQILSSHPEVGAAGEQGFWLQNRSSALTRGGDLDTAKLRNLSAHYLKTLANLAPDKARVVNKMPDNYLELGTIHAALPQAKIIHCVRHPVDTCISIYTTINRLRLDWLHRRENIVFVYGQYRRLMEHWKAVLQQEAIYQVSYEDLVTDRERVTREMIEFAGLDWDDACLRPEENPRAVATPSVWQVRQPVYTTSLARWRNYEPWLGEFASLS